MKRGELYMAGLDPVVGSEQGGRRPVVIIQNDLGNLHATTVIVAPFTGSVKRPLPTHVSVPAGQGGLRRTSTVLCEQVRTLEKSRLGRRIGVLDPLYMRQIDRALQISLDIGTTE